MFSFQFNFEHGVKRSVVFKDDFRKTPLQTQMNGESRQLPSSMNNVDEFWRKIDMFERVHGTSYREYGLVLPCKLNSQN